MIKRTGDEIMKDLIVVECDLSPENLSCDGEVSLTYQRQKYRQLMKKRKVLIRELGRTVSEDEIWDYSRKLKVY